MKINRPLTIAELINTLRQWPDDSKVCVETYDLDCLEIIDISLAASDAMPEPFGTDPIVENTVGVVCLTIEKCSHLGEMAESG